MVNGRIKFLLNFTSVFIVNNTMSSELTPLELTSEQFKSRFPEFISIHDDLIIANIEAAKVIVSMTFWKQYYLEAIALTAAHEIVLRQEEQLTTEMKLAAIRGGKSFTSFPKSNYYEMTSYGQRLLELKKKVVVTGFTI